MGPVHHHRSEPFLSSIREPARSETSTPTARSNDTASTHRISGGVGAAKIRSNIRRCRARSSTGRIRPPYRGKPSAFSRVSGKPNSRRPGSTAARSPTTSVRNPSGRTHSAPARRTCSSVTADTRAGVLRK